MEDNRMFGQRRSYLHKKRCQFCNKAVSNGYVVNDSNFRGFFCSAPHAQLAYNNMQEIATKEGIAIEGNDE